jgi:DNA replication protein DnaC
MRALKLDGMAEAFIELEAQDRAKDLSHAEWLALLLDRETASRSTRRFQVRLRSARLRHTQACVEDADYRTSRRLDKALFQQLATCRDLMEIVEDRYGRGSTLITSQLPVDKWHDIIDEPTFADAILDRLVHNAYRLALGGPSLRNPEAAEVKPTSVDAEPAGSKTTIQKPAKGGKK